MLVSLSREAQADANEAVGWYIGEGAFQAADEFTNELDKALAMLTTFPSLGGKSAHNTRIVPLHNFPYSLIYRCSPTPSELSPSPTIAAARGIGRDGGSASSFAQQ